MINKHVILRLFSVSLLPLFLLSCGGSGGGADDDEATVRYKAEFEEGSVACLVRLQWRDEEGNLHTYYDINESPWSRTIYPKDGAHLYLYAEIECGEITIRLYINGEQVERKTRTDWAEIDGYLRIDEDGNATFEDAE
ncbi:MAG: hypothetical protein V1789_06890 [PVC group bacterium]